ncbi:MAG: cytochrome c oxidase subunit II [Boseongicola sp.]|nr:cytochrome c oxidase subunit II [Boseongicola sp.]
MRLRTLLTGLTMLAAGTAAHAQDLPFIGQPDQAGLGFQTPTTELARDIQWLDGMVLIIITAISLFVMALLLICIVRFNRRVNPDPASFTHNTPVEVAWTVIPIVILVFIGAFSLPVLFKQQIIPEPEVFIKATGNQWYWEYEYPDEDISFASYMIGIDSANQLTPETSRQLAEAGYTDEHFLLATDTSVVIPTGKVVVVQVTAADVIHAWTIPSFGVKQDAVPGRLAELWFEVDEGHEGVYFGQCSELCGLSHSYMPITVKAVSAAEYDAWVADTRAAGNYIEPGPIRLAASE